MNSVSAMTMPNMLLPVTTLLSGAIMHCALILQCDIECSASIFNEDAGESMGPHRVWEHGPELKL